MTREQLDYVIERAIDSALGEVCRQTGGIDPQIMREARGAGVAFGRFLVDALQPKDPP